MALRRVLSCRRGNAGASRFPPLQKPKKKRFVTSTIVVPSNFTKGRFTNGDYFWRGR